MDKLFKVQNVEIPPRVVEIPNTREEGYSSVYRKVNVDLECGGQLISTFFKQPMAGSTIEILKGSSHIFRDNPCLGERVKDENGNWSNFKFCTYIEFYERCLAFGRGLLNLGLKRGDKVGIYSNNSIWWQTIHFGAASVGMIIVPVYDSLGANAAEYIGSHSGMKILCTNALKFETSLELVKKCDNIKYLAIMSNEKIQAECSVPYFSCAEILNDGKDLPLKNDFATPDDTAFIMYTSGSTGDPKGCVLTHRNIVSGAASFSCLGVSVSPSDVYLSFLPLAHSYALMVEVLGLCHGARCGYSRGSVAEFIEDITVLRPTAMIAVPRILNRVYDKMVSEIEKKPDFIKRFIFSMIEAKSNAVKKNRAPSLLLDAILFKKFRDRLGGRIRLIVNGGAPILQKVFDFLCATITPNIIQGYGLTETATGVAVQEVPVADPSTVGSCGLSCEVRLKAVEGTDYDAKGDFPTGELQVRGPIVFKGYYKQPELTKEVFDGDWFCTGDVVTITEAMQLKIVDRAKQLVKLSQGEYVSVTTLTELYGRAVGVSFIYVFADSTHDKLVALVIPTQEVINAWKNLGCTDFNAEPKCKEELMSSLKAIQKEHKLRGFEEIINIYIDTEEPTIANNLLTPSLKPQWNNLKKKYYDKLIALFD